MKISLFASFMAKIKNNRHLSSFVMLSQISLRIIKAGIGKVHPMLCRSRDFPKYKTFSGQSKKTILCTISKTPVFIFMTCPRTAPYGAERGIKNYHLCNFCDDLIWTMLGFWNNCAKGLQGLDERSERLEARWYRRTVGLRVRRSRCLANP